MIHAIETETDSKYAHLTTARCSCGWKIHGYVLPTMLGYSIQRHLETGE